MPERHSPPVSQIWRSRSPLAFLCLAVLAFPGCPKAHVAPKFPQVGVITPPTPPEVSQPSGPPEIASLPPDGDTPLPDAFSELPERPPAPHHIAPAAEADAAKPAPPQISPQLSPEDTARLQSDANADIEVARTNLNSVSGRRMNATQQDLADKIRSFMEQSRNAMAAGNWTEARNLAEKARVLSIELAHSF
jgi:hypothetical protein